MSDWLSYLMTFGWLGNIFIVIGLWFVGDRKRSAFIFTIIGELIWAGYAMHLGMWDLAIICLVFALLALRNWFKWGVNGT